MSVENIVDIIIPVHNQFSLVKECIESVLLSKSLIKSEVIVINDCSTELNLNEYLNDLKKKKIITLIVNNENLGFTRSVNIGMKLNLSRDVILLNSDTCVYGDWIDRLRLATHSKSNVATSIPLSNASHISNYPMREGGNDFVLEVDDEMLDELASQLPNTYAKVPATVGFCMYIKRTALESVGYFDDVNFPVGYGEETDFCYRARKIGWEHVVTGNVFVTHREGSSSFGERKVKLMEQMLMKFEALHPDFATEDDKLSRFDPVAVLRSQLDLARLKKAINNVHCLRIFLDHEQKKCHVNSHEFFLTFSRENNLIRISSPKINTFPNLRNYSIPRDLVLFNSLMSFLDINKILCASKEERDLLKHRISGLIFEVKLSPSLSFNS